MKKHTINGLIGLALCTGVSLAVAAPVALADGMMPSADSAYETREGVMKAIGGHMKALGAVAKGEAAMDASTPVHAQAVMELSHTVKFLFPEDSITEKSRANPEIWLDWDGFMKASMDFETASAALVEAAAGGDPAALGAALGGVGKTCGGCHKPFRGPEK